MANQVMTRSRFPESMQANIRAAWGLKLKKYKKIWTQYCHTVDSTENDEEFVLIPELGLPGLRKEAQGTPTDATGEYYKVAFRHFFQAKKIGFTRELRGDTKQPIVSELTMDFAEKFMQGKESAAAQLFNQAKAATMPSRYGGDKQPLLSTAHKIYDGTTRQNTTANYLYPTNGAFQTMLNMMRANRTDRNVPAPLMVKNVITSIGNCLRIKEIAGSMLKDDTTDNTKNVVQGEGVTEGRIIENPWITNPLFWGIQSDIPAWQGALFVDRMDLERNTDEDLDNWILWLIGGQRFSVGYLNWRWLFAQA